MAAQIGVDRSVMVRTWRAAGFPDPEPDAHVFAAKDVEMFEVLQAGLDFFGEDVIVQLLRVLGSAAARIADAAISAFFVNVVPSAVESDPSGLASARANTDSIMLLDGLTQGFDALVRHHLELGFRPQGTIEGSGGVDLVHKSVGFVDLVGSTSWTQQLDFRTLSRALTDFEGRASEVVVARGGRVVKLIGDEVMFVADDATAAARHRARLDRRVRGRRRSAARSSRGCDRRGHRGRRRLLGQRRQPRLARVDRGGAVNVAGRSRTRDALPKQSFACGTEQVAELKGFDTPVSLYEVTRTG